MNDIDYLICKHTGMRINEVIHLSKIEKAFILTAIQKWSDKNEYRGI